MDKLSALIKELETKIPFSEKLNLSVSRSSVGWHIQHTILASMQIIAAIEKSNPSDYHWEFNFKKILVFTLNKIPRGKAKAPKSVLPSGEIVKDDLLRDLQVLKNRIKLLPGLQPDNFFKHPFFGNLNLKATVKMLNIHTRHHIDIINDIIRAGK